MSYVATMPVMANPRYTRGLGDAITASHNVQIGGSLAASGAVAALGTIAAHVGTGSLLGITGATMTAAIPLVGAGLAAATMLVQYLVANSGCGQTCIETSSWANQAAAALQKVLDGYFANPAPRTATQKALAIAAFNDIWNQLQAACGQPGTGNAGVRCISDRQAGACTWHQKYAPTYPGQPNIGECWNWFNGYLAPIQQDQVVPDSAAVAGGTLASGGGLSLSSPNSLLPLLLIGGLVALGVSL
jgi:hypothetical protein